MTLLFDRQGGTYGSFSFMNGALVFDLQGGGYGYLLVDLRGGGYGYLLAFGRNWSLLRLHVTDPRVV